MANQTVQGKGFEYACLLAFHDRLIKWGITCQVEETQPYQTAKKHYKSLSKEVREQMLLAARASVKTILKSEPNLSDSKEMITISVSSDSSGVGGDVRDIIFLKGETGWEVGVSCKHNHHALKHSRLSQRIDFGQKWLGIPVSSTYFENIRPIFDYLSNLRDSTKDLPKSEQAKWSDIVNKEEIVYRPVLESFRNELLNLVIKNEGVPQRLIEYLLGNKDFYKVIAKDNERKTIIQAFNISGDLSVPYGSSKSQTKIKSLKNLLPTTVYNFDYKKKSNNTLELVMEQVLAFPVCR